MMSHKSNQMKTSVILQEFKTGNCMLQVQSSNMLRSDKTAPPPRACGQLTLQGLTMKGKRTIKRACAHLEHYNNSTGIESTFITLTIPVQMSDDEIKQAQRLLFKRWRHKYGNFMYVWVLEIQMKRLKKTGVRAPHLHICTSIPYIKAKKLRKQWASCVNRILGERRYEGYIHVDIQTIKYSLVRYMSKYLSKVDTETTGNNWSVSQSLRQYMKPTISVCKTENAWSDEIANLVCDTIPENFHIYIYGLYQFYFKPEQNLQIKEFFYTFAENNLIT